MIKKKKEKTGRKNKIKKLKKIKRPQKVIFHNLYNSIMMYAGKLVQYPTHYNQPHQFKPLHSLFGSS